MAIKIQGDTVIYDDKVFQVGSGNSAERPSTPQLGMVRFNTDLKSLEIYDGTEWGPISGGGGELASLERFFTTGEAQVIDLSSPTAVANLTVLNETASETGLTNLFLDVRSDGKNYTFHDTSYDADLIVGEFVIANSVVTVQSYSRLEVV